MNFLKIASLFVFPIIAGIISWLLSGYFLSRRDRYRNSAYKLFMIKIGWCLFWVLFAAVVVAKVWTRK